MIRRIQTTELGWLVSLANEFSLEYLEKPVDYTRTSTVMKHLIDAGVALRSDHGAIVGIIMDDLYYPETNLVELGWFSKDRSGLALLNEFEQIGRDHGVDNIRMTTLHTSPPAVRHLLQRRGYTSLDNSWELATGGH